MSNKLPIINPTIIPTSFDSSSLSSTIRDIIHPSNITPIIVNNVTILAIFFDFISER